MNKLIVLAIIVAILIPLMYFIPAQRKISLVSSEQDIPHHHHMMEMNYENVFLQMMDTMMMAMDSVPLDSSSEANFLRQMIPHHQGAIEMATYEIANGQSPEMVTLAKSILVEQQAEIEKMVTMLQNFPLQTGQPPAAEYTTAMADGMAKMMTNTPVDNDLADKSVDVAFAMVMLPHHQAAIDMAAVVLKFQPEKQVETYAQRVISDQQIEIEQMWQFVNHNVP